MGTFKDIISRRFSTSKSPLDYQLYKYEDLKDKWIIYQGNLQYLYNTTILGDSNCMLKKFLVYINYFIY